MLERELLSDERELLSDDVELAAELSDALWELVELVDSEVEIEQPTRRNSSGSSAARARAKPRMWGRHCRAGAKGKPALRQCFQGRAPANVLHAHGMARQSDT